MITPVAAVSLVALSCAVLLLLRPIVIFWLDPLDLRKYRAPSFLAATTPLWLMWETWMQRRSATIHAELAKCEDDVLRVAPNMLMFNDPQAVKDIYGHLAARKIVKDVFYDKIAGDVHDIVNTRDHDDHGRKRKYLANSFALKTVVDMEPVIRKNFKNLLVRIDAFCAASEADPKAQQSFNIRQWLNYFTLDVISDMAFGYCTGFLTQGGDSRQAQTQGGISYEVGSLINALQQGVRHSLTVAQVVSPRTVPWLKALSRCTPLGYRVTHAKDADDFENLCIYQLRKRLEQGPPERDTQDFIANILKDKAGSDRPVPFRELVAESQVLMNAGSDTTAAGLTSTIYHLLSNPETMSRLRAEVDSRVSPDDPQEILPYDLVRDLPYLRACIDETLRLRPPIAYPLQRLVVAPEGAIIAGRHIKQGTVVAVPPFSIHRKETVFPEPDRFNPDRWLNKDDPVQLEALRNYYIPFSQGPRACLGRHIAIIELQILISSLVRRYDIQLEREGQELLIFERFNSNPGPLPIRIRRRA
ncbi:uncharacterized protein PV07_07818 [Cladophialophora immunda]|uniref:Benzoate 4-monooxygenase n=1 Tax=Cladophialophora immunda TaxID=569365 RepID=A0A0D1ZJH3_9EURO|nr:uncharacterized protein PV07_07818 [Cladophialophora immunda]KIW28136.1 hypothetical protein PV07_07818 [Cladophialophora immunda]